MSRRCRCALKDFRAVTASKMGRSEAVTAGDGLELCVQRHVVIKVNPLSLPKGLTYHSDVRSMCISSPALRASLKRGAPEEHQVSFSNYCAAMWLSMSYNKIWIMQFPCFQCPMIWISRLSGAASLSVF